MLNGIRTKAELLWVSRGAFRASLLISASAASLVLLFSSADAQSISSSPAMGWASTNAGATRSSAVVNGEVIGTDTSGNSVTMQSTGITVTNGSAVQNQATLSSSGLAVGNGTSATTVTATSITTGTVYANSYNVTNFNPVNVNASGSGSFGGAMAVTGNQTIGGTLSVGGATTLSGPLTVTGATALNGGTSISNGLTVTGAATADTLTVNTLKVTGAFTFGDPVINGDTQVNGNMAVSGSTQTQTLSVTSNSTIGGSQTVSGNQTIQGSQTVAGNQAVGGNQTVQGNQTVGGGLTVSGPTQLGGNFAISGPSTGNTPASVDFGGNRLQDVGTPVNGSDAANKAYVDQGLLAANRRIDRVSEGVAIASSLATPDRTGNQTWAVAANWGNFEGYGAFSVSAIAAVAHDVLWRGDMISFGGGLGVGTTSGQVSGRISVQIAGGGNYMALR